MALAKTLISEANFLLLDEPTNHLDIQSVNILIQALQQYEGSFIIVSHNRHFISQVANKIWWIENEELKEYPGTYEEFDWWMAQRTSKPSKPQPVKKEKPIKQKTAKPKTDHSLQREIDSIEKKIEKAEEEVDRLEAEMAKPEVYQDAEKAAEADTAYKSMKKELDELTTKWEELLERYAES